MKQLSVLKSRWDIFKKRYSIAQTIDFLGPSHVAALCHCISTSLADRGVVRMNRLKIVRCSNITVIGMI